MKTETENYGDLYDYQTGEFLRKATPEEALASYDSGAGDEGVFPCDYSPEHRDRSCYVDGADEEAVKWYAEKNGIAFTLKIGDRILNSVITLEVCTNAEWLTEYGSYIERCGDELDSEAAMEFRSRLVDEIEKRLPKAVCVNAKGQRSLLHGWNGAQFVSRCGPVGSWCKLTDQQTQLISAAIEAAMEPART